MGFSLALGEESAERTSLLTTRRNVELSPDRRQQWLALSSQFESIDHKVELFESGIAVSYGFDTLAVSVSLFEDGADVEGPFSAGGDQQARWLALGELLTVVQHETSWSLFNPQTDRIETVQEMLAGSGIFPLSSGGTDSEPAAESSETGSRRRRLFRKQK